MVNPGTPYQKELGENGAAGNHPERTALVHKATRQPRTRPETPSLSLPLRDAQLAFNLGLQSLPGKLVSVLEKREGLGKDLAQVTDVTGKQNYAREEELGFPLCHFCC